jgi:hypothetical protein
VSEPDHLPKLRRGGKPAPPEQLPRQRVGTTPQQRGRYPDFDALAQAKHWDPVTRRVVLERVERVPKIRFFTPAEATTLGAFCDVAMAQDAEPRIPVLEMVDAKLYERRLDGFRHADMPEDPETWRRVARQLDVEASARGHHDGFAAAPDDCRREIAEAFSKGELDWDDLPSSKAFGVLMRAVLSAFYSHPWAWSEIGFGGPAYPRGYARLGAGQREPWERSPQFDPDPVQDVEERGLE